MLDDEGYLFLTGRSEGADQPRRREDLADRGRRGAPSASGRRRGVHVRHPPRQARRGGRRRGRARRGTTTSPSAICAPTSTNGWPRSRCRDASCSSPRSPRVLPARSNASALPTDSTCEDDRSARQSPSTKPSRARRRAMSLALPVKYSKFSQPRATQSTGGSSALIVDGSSTRRRRRQDSLSFDAGSTVTSLVGLPRASPGPHVPPCDSALRPIGSSASVAGSHTADRWTGLVTATPGLWPILVTKAALHPRCEPAPIARRSRLKVDPGRRTISAERQPRL